MNKGISVLLTMTILSGIVLMSNTTSATKSVSNASVTVPEACTMTGSGMNSHTATITPGTFSAASGSDYENGIGKTTFTVICNDYNGFSIYAIGYTGDSYDDTNHTKLVGSNTNIAIDTAVYSGGDTTSSWSMKVNKVTDSTISYLPANMSIQNSFDSWHAVPDTYTKVAQYKASTGSSTTDTTLGTKIDTTYAAFIAPNQPGDTYTGQVKYTMVHPYSYEPAQPRPTASGKICYYANAGDAIGTMGCQTISASATSATLIASNFSRTGYGFAGWSDKFDYTTNHEAHFYGPNEDITFAAGQYGGSNPGLSLYAIWIPSAGLFQDSSKVTQLCGTGAGSLTQTNYDSTTGILSANLTSVVALTDNRDNQTYAIAKLADGNCWMIENLRLDNTAELTTLNTNNPLNDNDPTNPTVTLKHNYTDTTTYNTLSATSNVAYDETNAPNGWCSDNSSACDDQSRIRTDNTFNRATYSSGQTMSTNANIYSYGNYYNWYSATAGRGTFNKSYGNTNGDLCPIGWKLPYGNTGTSGENRGGANGGFSYLDKQMGGDGTNASINAITGGTTSTYWRKFPNSFVYSGNTYTEASLSNRGSGGSYWSATANSTSKAYYLAVSVNGLGAGTHISYGKYQGRTIRCLVPPSV